jgi:hypothetical protein
MDMTNDNYYKSQGSDFIKEIKCNNINSNFNGVDDNIGTDDGLIGVADTSLQEGDEDSANGLGNGERTSNRNFDVDCINNNDNENNPVGTTQLTIGTNIYLVQDSDSGVDSILNGLPICDPGDFVLNGGYILGGTFSDNTIVNQNTPLVFDIPSLASPGQAWVVNAVGLDSGTNHNLLVNAYCFDNPPEHMP